MLEPGRRWSARRGAMFALVAVVVLLAVPAMAAPTFTIANGQCDVAPARCTATNGKVTAHAFSPRFVNFIDPSGIALAGFKSAFDSWNASLPAGAKWTYATEPLSDAATITVVLYRAFVNEGDKCGERCGGAEIQLRYSGGADDLPRINALPPTDGSAVWSQNITTNQKKAGSLPGNPYLDNPANTPPAPASCSKVQPPATTYQCLTSFFYDKPSRDADAVWEATAWLSTTDYTYREITLLAGVEWGFTVTAVPEPHALVLTATGLLALGALRRIRTS